MIHIAEILCEDGHSAIAMAFDPNDYDDTEKIEEMLRKQLPSDDICDICSGELNTFHVKKTRFDDLDEIGYVMNVLPVHMILSDKWWYRAAVQLARIAGRNKKYQEGK